MPDSANHPGESRRPSPSKRPTPPQSQSPSSYLSYPVKHVVSGLYRRLTEPSAPPSTNKSTVTDSMSSSGLFTPPRRTGSPFQPPPLTPLTLKSSENATHLLLTRSLAEEIRLLVPPRLQLIDTWQLAYSLDRDGSSLATLYKKCEECSQRSQRAGYVLVVRDASSPQTASSAGPGGNGGAVFGAYLTDPPRPAPHYFGTGECFLWRASVLPSTPLVQVSTTTRDGDGDGGEDKDSGTIPPSEDLIDLSGLPLPPSADTTKVRGRSTTLIGEESKPENDGNNKQTGGGAMSNDGKRGNTSRKSNHLQPHQAGEQDGSRSRSPSANLKPGASRSGTSTPERIRFKAFPYSGVNDYMIFCETGFLSVGGG